MTTDLGHQHTAREGLTDPVWLRADATTSLPNEATITGRIEFQHTPQNFLIRVDRSAPPWLIATIEALNRLLTLRPNWDSYGAPAIEPSCAIAAIELLSLVMRADTPAPTAVPTNHGSIQLEWHKQGVDLEIEVLSPQRFAVSFEDSVSGEAWEREITVDLTPLVKSINRLTQDGRPAH